MIFSFVTIISISQFIGVFCAVLARSYDTTRHINGTVRNEVGHNRLPSRFRQDHDSATTKKPHTCAFKSKQRGTKMYIAVIIVLLVVLAILAAVGYAVRKHRMQNMGELAISNKRPRHSTSVMRIRSVASDPEILVGSRKILESDTKPNHEEPLGPFKTLETEAEVTKVDIPRENSISKSDSGRKVGKEDQPKVNIGGSKRKKSRKRMTNATSGSDEEHPVEKSASGKDIRRKDKKKKSGKGREPKV